MKVEITPTLHFTLKEGQAFIETDHQTFLIKPNRHEMGGQYILIISRILDNEYKSLQDLISDCSNKIELINIDKERYAKYLDCDTSQL